MAGGVRDAWLFGGARKRAAIQKGAKRAAADNVPLEASSMIAYRALTEDPRDGARITDWGSRSDPKSPVSIIKSGVGEDPPPSRQLRDPFTTFYVQGIALEPPLPPDRLLNLTEENAIHAACLAALATDACGRGWEFAPREGKKGDKDLIQSEMPEKLKAAMEDLTPDLTFGEMLVQAAWEMRAIGWGVWEVVRVNNDGTPGKHGEIGAIYPIPSHTIRATLDPRKWVQIRAGRVRYFKAFGAECTINNETGEVFEWKGRDRRRADETDEASVASEIIIFKSYTPRSLWYGLPPWISAIATIAELSAIREFNISWFASGGQVDYHIHFKGETIEAALKMKEQTEDQIRENAGRGHTKLFTAGDKDTEVKVAQLGELLREGHFRFRRGDLVKEVLIAHSVPPYRIGWAETGSLGGNAADEMLGAYRLGAVEPIQAVIEDRLRMTLFDPKKGIKTDEFRLKLHVLELEDVKAALEMARAGVDTGFMTPNQAREQMDLDPDKDNSALDKYYYKGTELGQPAQPPGGGWPGADFEEPTDGVDQGQADQWQEEVPKAKTRSARPPLSVRGQARRAVFEALSVYEDHLKSRLADSDPIDSDQPPPTKPRRGRGGQKPVTVAGPARDDKPNIS